MFKRLRESGAWPLHFRRFKQELLLRAQETLERQPGTRKRGRPRIVASWFGQLAAAMADGTPLRLALQRHGIAFDTSQIRTLYRNKELRRMYRECRGRYYDADGKSGAAPRSTS
jgi:hypothetical protein